MTPPDHFVADGVVHRFVSDPSHKGVAGWYIIHPDPGGDLWFFGDWRTNIKVKGNGADGHTLTPKEAAERRKRLHDLQVKAEADKARFQAGAAIEAQERWDNAPAAPSSHPYLQSKGVDPCGTRFDPSNNRLLVPMRDGEGRIWSLQEIGPDGFKHNQPGGRRRECFFQIGEIGDTFCAAEGFSTAASIHRATGFAVISAGEASNLEAVARIFREKYPEATIIVCGDDDWLTKVNGKARNVGKIAATEAAEAVGGILAMPWFTSSRPQWATDFNDMAKLLGTAEVATRIKLCRVEHEEAKAPKAPKALSEVIAVFDKWLMLRDHTPIYAVLGTVAANLLAGDPVWCGIIAPPSSAKTEILNSLLQLPYIHPTATLSPAALLSGTPKRQRDKGSPGGLLRKVDEFGILVLKDFGSILSMRAEAKAEILAALREIYDGSWTRHLGTDGGKTLTWSGKVGLIFGSTQAYDDHHSVIGSLGDRFLLCRLRPSNDGLLRRALDHAGAATKVMREELAVAVAGLFASTRLDPPPLSEHEIERLDRVVALATRLRAHVNRDRHSREVESVHDAEGPGRMGLALERLLAGLSTIGLDRATAMTIMEDIALSSAPPIRRHAFELLNEEPVATRIIARALKLPTTTSRRALEELHAHGLAVRTRGTNDDGEEKQGGADLWRIDPEWASWQARWAETKK